MSSERLVSDPSMAQVIEDTIDNFAKQLNVAMPAQVVSYDDSTNTISAQPTIMRKYSDGTVKALPVLNMVPVKFDRSTNAWLKFPVSAGDYVQLVFSQRSLAIWLNQGGVVDPQDPRKFSLSDAVAYLGGYPFANAAVAVDSDNVELRNLNAMLSLVPGGKFRLEKIGGDEVIDLLVQITEQLRVISNSLGMDTTNTAFGPMKLNDFATYVSAASTIQSLENRLTALQG